MGGSDIATEADQDPVLPAAPSRGWERGTRGASAGGRDKETGTCTSMASSSMIALNGVVRFGSRREKKHSIKEEECCCCCQRSDGGVRPVRHC